MTTERIPTGKLGAFGVLGGEVILYGNWVPDPDEPNLIADQIMGLAGYLENTEKPLLASARIARADTQRRFDLQEDPDGFAWTALDPDYEEYKLERGGGDRILVWTDEMRKAAVSQAAWRVQSDTLVFDPSGLPDYAAAHQEGSGEENVGKARDARERTRAMAGVEGFERGGAKESIGVGRGHALPARPFIGLSEEAIVEIAEVFDLWFQEGIENIFVHPLTGVAQRRLPSGRFGTKI